MPRAEADGFALRTTAFRATVARGAVIRARALQVATGEIVGLSGPNGSGKTTLLRALAGELRPVDGHIWLGDREVTRLDAPARARAGLRLLPQVNHTFSGLTVAENLRVSTHAPDARRNAADALRRFLPGLDFRAPAGLLSGGERQILALVMTFAAAAQVYLMDEPYVGLDTGRVQAVREALRAWLEERRAAALIVDHDLGRLADDCHRVIAISELAELDFA